MDAYRVDQDTPGCLACEHGATWGIIGPDDVAHHTTYGDRDDAELIARDLNAAFEAGRAAAFAIVARRVGPDDRRITLPAVPPEAGERRRYPGIADGRRKADDGIPF